MSDIPSHLKKQNIVVSDVDIKFTSMVWILVKLAFAAIPAMFIIMFVSILFMTFFGAFTKALFGV